jgi:hypothetical protein
VGREVPVFVDARAEQPLQLRRSSRDGDAWFGGRGGAWKRLPVAANGCFLEPFDQLAKPPAGRQIEVGLKRMLGHAEALLRETVDPGGATTTRRRNP